MILGFRDIIPFMRILSVVTICGLSAFVLCLSACSHAPTLRAGAVNAFDSNAYDTLITTQAALEEAKTNIAAQPAFKDSLNQAIVSYNAAMDLYVVYHKAAAAGSAPDSAELSAAIAKAVSQVAELVRKVKPPTPAAVLLRGNRDCRYSAKAGFVVDRYRLGFNFASKGEFLAAA